MSQNQSAPAAVLRHDTAIALSMLRRISRAPLDLATIIIVLPVLALIARAAISGLPMERSKLLAFLVSWILTASLTTFLSKRVEYHRTDGCMVSTAFGARVFVFYGMPLFIVGAAAIALLLAILGAGAPLIWLTGIVAGLLSALAWASVWRPTLGQVIAHRPIFNAARHLKNRSVMTITLAGVLAGIGCIVIEAGTGTTVSVFVVALFATLLLGRVSADRVQYMTLVGHTSWSIARAELRGFILFFGPFAAALTMASEWVPSVIAAGFLILVPTGTILLILAYRSFSRRMAEWTVTVLIGVIALMAFSLPPSAPFAALAALIWLARRAAHQTWLIT